MFISSLTKKLFKELLIGSPSSNCLTVPFVLILHDQTVIVELIQLAGQVAQYDYAFYANTFFSLIH